jgi:amino acid transporter
MTEELKKSLGFYSIFALIVTSLLGTSLFFGISTGAALAGAASIISWILMGVIAVYISACFAELISMYPTSGGVYEFTKQAFGRFPSFLVGWIAWIVANIGSAVLVVAAMDFIMPASGVIIFAGIALDVSAAKLISAIAIILLFNYITYRGARTSGVVLVLFSLIIIGVLIAIIVPGFSLFDASRYASLEAQPLMLFAAVFFIVECFFGWESASFLAEETQNAERTIPKALIAATTVVALLGISLAFVLFGAFTPDYLAYDSAPVQSLVRAVFPAALPFVAWGIFLMFLGGVISSVVSSPRLLFALARDRLFIEQCTKVHPVHGTPVNAIAFQTIITVIVVIIAFGRYHFLLSMLVPLALLMYAIVLLTLPVLRWKQPELPRPALCSSRYSFSRSSVLGRTLMTARCR